MNNRLCCPRCQGHRVQCTRYASWGGPVGAKLMAEWHCQSCGEFCHQPNESFSAWPILDVAVGIAVLAATAISVLIACS